MLLNVIFTISSQPIQHIQLVVLVSALFCREAKNLTFIAKSNAMLDQRLACLPCSFTVAAITRKEISKLNGAMKLISLEKHALFSPVFLQPMYAAIFCRMIFNLIR